MSGFLSNVEAEAGHSADLSQPAAERCDWGAIQLRAIAGAAVRSSSGVPLPSTARTFLEWAQRVVTDALREHTGAPVALKVLGAPAAPLPDPALVFRCTGGVDVALDLACARALADAASAELGGLRGVGGLSGVERGLLEYLALEVLDALHRGSPKSMSEVALESIEREYRRHDDAASFHGVGFEVTCAGAAGSAIISLPVWTGRPLPHFPDWRPTRSDVVGLTLMLRPVVLPSGQVEAAEAGDALLLGVPELAGFATDATLTTTTGWSLASARVLEDSPTLTTVEPGGLEPSMLRFPEPPAGHEVLLVSLGLLELEIARLVGWAAGEPLGLPRNPPGGARIHRGARPPWRAELVRCKGEAAARILSR